MKKILKNVGLVVIITLVVGYMAFVFYSCFSESYEPKKYISKITGIDIEKCSIEEENDTHGGFLGDGESFLKINCSNIDDLRDFSNWKKMPLSSFLKEALELWKCDDCLLNSERYSIFENNSGYYYFVDRNSEATDIYDETTINERYSYNFSLVVYDENNKIFYFYGLDT